MSKKSAPQTVRAHRFIFEQPGSPDVLKWVEAEVGAPGDGQVRLRQTAIGLNYIDTYHRSGLYKMPLPSQIGLEAAGIVEAIGKGVKGFKVGDRVAYGFGAIGGYSTHRLIGADKLVKIPSGIKDETAAAMMLKGMTAEYLLHRTYKVKKGDTILVHAAAGGVGLILCQWAKALGVTVIGTVGNDEKAKLAKAHGCKYPIVYTRENFVDRVKQITKGKGVPVAYDSIGKDTFQGTMECLAPRGYFVSFGNASGPVPPFDPAILAPKGLFYTRAALGTYVASRADLELSSGRLFNAVKSGKVKIRVNQRYALKDAPQAHRDLEGRKTTGSTVFMP
ncbi:MAG: quinone oxidoreductase [Alphaproteobacteria bacterium]